MLEEVLALCRSIHYSTDEPTPSEYYSPTNEELLGLLRDAEERRLEKKDSPRISENQNSVG